MLELLHFIQAFLPDLILFAVLIGIIYFICKLIKNTILLKVSFENKYKYQYILELNLVNGEVIRITGYSKFNRHSSESFIDNCKDIKTEFKYGSHCLCFYNNGKWTVVQRNHIVSAKIYLMN